MSAPASPFRHWIDSPSSPELASPCLCVRGWFYREDGDPVRGLRVVAGSETRPGRHGLHRPDVLSAFGVAAAEHSGFEAALILPTGAREVRLEACDTQGRWETVTTIPVHCAIRSPLQSLTGRLGFWLRALLGRTDAFTRLTPEEQDYLLAGLSARGLHGAGQLFHHEPRPLRLERFPRRSRSPAQRPKFTIVTPSFNQARFLAQTAQSVLSQQGVRIDYILQDGGSNDGSASLIRDLAERHPVRDEAELPIRITHWESAADKGQADAIAKGFRHTRCGPDDVMAYLNSDDVLMPGALAYVADWFLRHPETDAVYGHRVLIDEQGAEIGRWVTPRRHCDDLALMDLIPQETLFWRRRLWDKVGGIDSSFHFAMDWDLLLRFTYAGARIDRLTRFLAQFRIHSRQKTQSWMGEHGLQEMDRLRARSLDRVPSPEELAAALRLARFDGALCQALMEKGLRV